MTGWSSIGLALRSIAWTILLPGLAGILLPGLAAVYLPWRYFGLARVKPSLRNPVHLIGLLGITLGRAYEEPALRRRFGAAYERYTERVGRWLPRLRFRPAVKSEPSRSVVTISP